MGSRPPPAPCICGDENAPPPTTIREKRYEQLIVSNTRHGFYGTARALLAPSPPSSERQTSGARHYFLKPELRANHFQQAPSAMAAIFWLVANIMANKGAEPAPLRRVQTVVKRPRCVGDFTQVVGVRTQGIGLHAHLVDGRPILIALDLVVLGLAFLRIGTLRFPRRGRSLLPQLEQKWTHSVPANGCIK